MGDAPGVGQRAVDVEPVDVAAGDEDLAEASGGALLLGQRAVQVLGRQRALRRPGCRRAAAAASAVRAARAGRSPGRGRGRAPSGPRRSPPGYRQALACPLLSARHRAKLSGSRLHERRNRTLTLIFKSPGTTGAMTSTLRTRIATGAATLGAARRAHVRDRYVHQRLLHHRHGLATAVTRAPSRPTPRRPDRPRRPATTRALYDSADGSSSATDARRRRRAPPSSSVVGRRLAVAPRAAPHPPRGRADAALVARPRQRVRRVRRLHRGGRLGHPRRRPRIPPGRAGGRVPPAAGVRSAWSRSPCT